MKSTLQPLGHKGNEQYKELPSNCAFADFETRGLGGAFIYGGIVFNFDDTVHFFKDITEFFTLIVRQDCRTIYFHNLEYDGRYIIRALVDDRVNFNLINRCGRLLCIRIGQISIIDSYALFVDKLKKLSMALAPEFMKKDLNLEQEIFNPNDPVHLEYLVYDCLALKYIMNNGRKIIHDNFSINGKMTTSSTALRAWQTTLNTTLFRTGKEKDEFLRQSYSGGLVFMQSVNVYHDITVFDVNSMYPSVMRDYKFPYGQSGFTDHFEGQGFYKVEVNADNAQFHFINGFVDGVKIARCKGHFISWITDHEYILGLELGYRFKIIEGLVFENSGYLFTEFVDKCEHLRLAHNKDGIGQTVKFIQNSLYGKFGTKPERESIYFNDDILEDKTPYVDPITGEFYGLYVDIENADENYMLPYLASYTTALARCKLTRLTKTVGFTNAVYGDTDSLFVHDSVAHKLDEQIGNRYGQIKQEAHFKSVLVVAPKLYFGKDKNRAKGFPSGYNGEKIVKLRDQLINGEHGELSFTGLNSVRSILRNKKAFSRDMTRTIPALPEAVLNSLKGVDLDQS